jgi:hypothetical protein
VHFDVLEDGKHLCKYLLRHIGVLRVEGKNILTFIIIEYFFKLFVALSLLIGLLPAFTQIVSVPDWNVRKYAIVNLPDTLSLFEVVSREERHSFAYELWQLIEALRIAISVKQWCHKY